VNISVRNLHVYCSVPVKFGIMMYLYFGRKLNYVYLDAIRAVVCVITGNELQISGRHNNFIILNFNTVCYMFRPYFDSLQGIYMHYLKPRRTLVKNIFCNL
jgi:hypothetical protein